MTSDLLISDVNLQPFLLPPYSLPLDAEVPITSLGSQAILMASVRMLKARSTSTLTPALRPQTSLQKKRETFPPRLLLSTCRPLPTTPLRQRRSLRILHKPLPFRREPVANSAPAAQSPGSIDPPPFQQQVEEEKVGNSNFAPTATPVVLDAVYDDAESYGRSKGELKNITIQSNRDE